MAQRRLRLAPVWVTLLLLCMLLPARTFAGQAACTNLAAQPGTGAAYVFTATASGSNDNITGYTFTFGDHQSYTVTFSSASQQDHRTATVTHTYQKDGTYTPKVHINIKNKSTEAHTPSLDCQTSLTIGSSDNALPNTGAGNPYTLFAVTALVGIASYQLWLRRRNNARTSKTSHK